MTEKQREAIKAMLALHKEGSITADTAMTVIEAVFESGASVQYIPYTMPCEPYKSTPNPFSPIITYSSEGTTSAGATTITE